MFESMVAFHSALALAENEIHVKKQEMLLKNYMNSVASTYHTQAKPKVTAPRMCPCCHSREFKYHHQRLICSYCRTGV